MCCKAGEQNEELLYAGSWLQATGSLLTVLFFLDVVRRSAAWGRLAGLVVVLASAVLLAIVMAEALFTITWASAAANGQPITARTSFDLMASFIRIFAIVPAPAIFIALGIVLRLWNGVPPKLATAALVIGGAFEVAGLLAALVPSLSAAVAALSALQIVWTIAAAIILRSVPEPAG